MWSRRHPRDEQQKRHEDRQLADDELQAGQRLRQIDLQRGATQILGDGHGAERHGDEKDEEVLFVEEVAECGGRRRNRRGLRKIRRDVELHAADDELNPRRDHQHDPAAAAHHRPDAGRENHEPGAPARLRSLVVPVPLIVNRHQSSPTACANTSSSVGTLGRRCRTCTPSAVASANNCCAPPSPGTKTRNTSSSVAWHSSPAAFRRSKNVSSSPCVFTRSSYMRPRGCFNAAIGPDAAIRPLSITTTSSHTCSTSGRTCDERIRLTFLLCARS